MKVEPEKLAESLINEAHSSVKGQFFIEFENRRHVIYVHDIMIKPSGELDIQYSTPSEDVDKEWLSSEVHKAMSVIINEQPIKPSFTDKIINFTKSLFKGK